MSEYFQNFNHLIKVYIQCTIQNSQTSEQFCFLLYDILHFPLLLSRGKTSSSNLMSLVLGDSCAPASNPPPVGGGLVVALWSLMPLLLSSQRYELTVVLVRFAPDCPSVLLCDCLGHTTFHFAITIPLLFNAADCSALQWTMSSLLLRWDYSLCE